MINQVNQVKRGALFFAKLADVGGRVQNGMRPVLVIQNNAGNKFSQTTIVVPLTSRNKKSLPTHIRVGKENGLSTNSTILAEQIICIDKAQIGRFVGQLPESIMKQVDRALAVSIGLPSVGA